VKSKQLRTTSVANSTFSFNFTGTSLIWAFIHYPNAHGTLLGNELFLNTLASASGGKLSLSINDDAPEVFDTTAPTASCALLNLNVTALVKRSLLQRADSSSAEAQNQCVGKSVSGTTALDGVTYVFEISSPHVRSMNCTGIGTHHRAIVNTIAACYH
jgi:hypothetical protein